MHIPRYLPLLVLPVVVTATVSEVRSDYHDISLVQVDGVSQDELHVFMTRALDIGDIVDNIKGLIEPILDLIKPESLDNINTIITNLASLLGDGGAQDTKGLVGTISDLLNSDAIQDLTDQLGPLLPVRVSSIYNAKTNDLDIA